MKKIIGILLCSMMLLLAGCSGADEPVSLVGEWKQSNPTSETSYQTAKITDTTIEVYWYNAETSTESLYWAGTYTAPGEGEKEYSWDSVNDKEKTDMALLASGDDTKTFSYANGVLSYDVTAMGMTQKVKLEKIQEQE